MSNLLLKIKTIFFGPPGGRSRTGVSISSAGPESDFKPKPRPVGSSIEIDEPDALPPIGEWRRLPNGDRVRRIGVGRAIGSEMLEDVHEDIPARSRNLTGSGAWQQCRRCGRMVPGNEIRGKVCDWCRM